MSRIAGSVILYYPNEDLKGRIDTYLNHVEKLYIIDNSEKPTNFNHSSEKVVYISNGINEGIANRLNQCAQLAIASGFEWLLTMDQDSFFHPLEINNYIECFCKYERKENVAVFGVQFEKTLNVSSTCHSEDSTLLITSGSLINLNLYLQIGSFDETLFIDQVDFEYCYRSKSKGFMTIQFKNIFLEHALGNKSTCRSLKSFQKTQRILHSPIRLYYMTRNYFYMRDKYGNNFPIEMEHAKKDLLNRIKNNLLYGDQKLSVFKNIIVGFLDYKRKKMGKKG